jgi:putative two-component system hydrogenase maturation factor HypX/HoxX
VELDINDESTIKAVNQFAPDLIIAPYLKRAIPAEVWQNICCIIIHPGIAGDRGPSSLDWAIMNDEREWGVTALQAEAEMDAGAIWASETFAMRFDRKSSLYHHEVTETAVKVVRQTLERFMSKTYSPKPLDDTDPKVRGKWRPAMRQDDRAVDWKKDNTATVLKKIHSGDGAPGALDTLFDEKYYLYNAYKEGELRGTPGAIIAKRHDAICRATCDGAVWITHLKKYSPNKDTFKLPASYLLQAHLDDVPEHGVDLSIPNNGDTYRDIFYHEAGDIGFLHFDFYNGAMSTGQCQRLLNAYRYAQSRSTRIIVLMGGRDFWSNGIHLNIIEAAESPAEESWQNINAIDDLAEAIITTDDKLTVSAINGNAGGGGVFLALAADYVFAREGVVLNPHYKNMGNLYGSEYWTYLLPKRTGEQHVNYIMGRRLPMGVQQAKACGLIDDYFGTTPQEFNKEILETAGALIKDNSFNQRLLQKANQRKQDEQKKPLAQYRKEELQRMHMNFFGFDPSYHVARYNFVHKRAHGWTPLHLAKARQ